MYDVKEVIASPRPRGLPSTPPQGGSGWSAATDGHAPRPLNHRVSVSDRLRGIWEMPFMGVKMLGRDDKSQLGKRPPLYTSLALKHRGKAILLTNTPASRTSLDTQLCVSLSSA